MAVSRQFLLAAVNFRDLRKLTDRAIDHSRPTADYMGATGTIRAADFLPRGRLRSH